MIYTKNDVEFIFFKWDSGNNRFYHCLVLKAPNGMYRDFCYQTYRECRQVLICIMSRIDDLRWNKPSYYNKNSAMWTTSFSAKVYAVKDWKPLSSFKYTINS